jgi:signal transduction histidine kinase
MILVDRYYTRGEMAGDIAHEINNYLAIISGNVELIPLMIKRGQLDKLAQKSEVMRTAVERIAMFCDGFMDPPSSGTNYPAVDMNKLILHLLSFLTPQNRFDDITIETHLTEELPAIQLDPAQIRQVLINLLNNSADSLADATGERRITISTHVRANGDKSRAILEVSDSGAGVSASNLSMLFEKSFTTKPQGRGIGLHICRRIIDNHHGQLSYRYADGAVFTLELPVNQPESHSVHTVEASESIPVTC